MNWLLWGLIGIVGAFILLIIIIRVYFYVFAFKTIKSNHKILNLLDEGGLLKDFKENRPFEEVKDKYFEFVDLVEKYAEYVHFKSLREEKKYERKNDCLVLQHVNEKEKHIVRMHLRAFPIKSLPEKLNTKRCMIDMIKISNEVLWENKDIDYVELITHNQVINESIIKKMIERYDLHLTYTFDDKYETGYLPWIYAEWFMIHGKDNPKSRETYEGVRKINCPVDVKIFRKQ